MICRRWLGVVTLLSLEVACRSQAISVIKLSDVSLPDSFAEQRADADGAIEVSFDQPPPGLVVGETWVSNFTVISEKPLIGVVLAYARDGQTVSESFELDSAATSFSLVAKAVTPTARVRLAAVDTLGRVGWLVSNAFAIVTPGVSVPDVTPPPPPDAILLTKTITNSRDAVVRVSCLVSEHASVAVGLNANSVLFADCSASTVDVGQLLPDQDGTHTLYVWGRDLAGNTSLTATALTVVLDREAPLVVISGLEENDAFATGSMQVIDYSATDANAAPTSSVVVELSNDDGGSYLALPAQPLDLGELVTWAPITESALVRLRISVTDLAGNVGEAVSPKLVVTGQAPQLSRLWLNDDDGLACGVDATTTAEQLATAHIRVTDPVGALVTDYCVRTRSVTRPSLLDPCWRAVPTPAKTLDLSVPVGLGYVPGLVTVRMWTKNNAGIVSALAAGVGVECQDRRRIAYQPGEPPLVESVTAFVTNTEAQPYAEADVTLAGSAAVTGPTQVFVKWNAVFQGVGQSAMPGSAHGPVELSYAIGATQTFTVIAGGIAHNATTGGCTLSAGQSGCYVWTPPDAVRDARYVRVRVRAIKALGISAASTAVVPLNQWPVRYLMGNPDPGYGGHALSTLFVSRLQDRQGFRHGTLAVSSLGVVYFLDIEAGIFWVNPNNGSIESLVPKAGSITDQANGVSLATAFAPTSLAIDANDNLLFWDYNRIRRVNVGADGTPSGLGASVETIVDGSQGASFLGDDQDPLTQVRLPVIPSNVATPLIATLDGDIYFPSSIVDLAAGPGAPTGFALRRYHQTVNGPRVDTVYLSGDGFWRVTSPVLGGSTASLAFSGGFLTFDQSGATQLFALLSTVGFDGIATYNPDGTTSQSPVGYRNYPSFYGPPYGFFFTGADGKLYYWNTWGPAELLRYDPGDYLTTHVAPSGGLESLQTRVLGSPSSTAPRCKDGDNASTCFLDVQDVFVDRFSAVYILAQGQVFALQENGTLARIFGRGYEEGRTGPALNPRLGYIPSVATWWDAGDDATSPSADDREHIVTVDALSLRVEESMLGNGVVNTSDGEENRTIHLAGNGEYSASKAAASLLSPATTLPLRASSMTSIVADPTEGFVYFDQDTIDSKDVILRLRRDFAPPLDPPAFEIFAGGGASAYSGANGQPARDISIGNQRNLWGFANGELMVAMNQLTGGGDHIDGYMATFDGDTTIGANNTMSLFAGDPGSFSTGPVCVGPSGTSDPILKENCHLLLVYEPSTFKAVHHDSAFVVNGVTYEPGWIMSPYSSWDKHNIPDQAGAFVKRVFDGSAQQLTSFTYRAIGAEDHLYGCRSDGVLVDANLDTGVSTILPFSDFPVVAGARTMVCVATHLEWNPRRGTLEFAYQQAGLFGVAEYVLP